MLFANNRATYGGAVWNDGSNYGRANPTFNDCLFSNNTATALGGAIFNQSDGFGAASPLLLNCSFVNNRATDDGGAVYDNGYRSGTLATTLANCVFWNNGGGAPLGIINLQPAPFNSSYCLFESGTTGMTGTTNRFASISPFVSAPSLQLAACSPAIGGSDQRHAHRAGSRHVSVEHQCDR